MILNSFSITTSTYTPVSYTSTNAPYTIDGGKYTITIDVGTANNWTGLFNYGFTGNSSNLLTIQNLYVTFSSGLLFGSGSSYMSIILKTSGYNPQVTFQNCSLYIPTTVSTNCFTNVYSTTNTLIVGGFIGSIGGASNANSTTMLFNNCIYNGPSIPNGGGFIAGSISTSSYNCTITFTNCVAEINNPSYWATSFSNTATSGGACYMGRYSSLHTLLIQGCISNYATIANFSRMTGMVGNNYKLTATNSYVIISDSSGGFTSTSQRLLWIAGSSPSTSTISNCYFVNQYALNNSPQIYPLSASGSTSVTAVSCAFSSITTNTGYVISSQNTNFTYTYSGSTTGTPFVGNSTYSWDTSIWDNLNNASPTTPPTLKAFTITPFNSSSYTTAGTFPTFAP